MPDRLRRRVQPIPNMEGIADKAVQEPMTLQEEEGLAQMALISGVPATNTPIRNFLQGLNNRAFGQIVQAGTR